ncbi:unnamed protein product [Brassica oleracea]|uniref:Uncharacterized protein n=1 Tax=Brassica oleracea TaxID=3712 RepID=A0A3P6DWT0_BRAOL|nr:unnamed protein product [Brassica oleracea]
MKRGSSLLFVWRRCGDDCVSSHNLNGRFNGSMIHHPRSTFNEWPQPQNEEICLAMEEAEFEEKATSAPAPITSPEINIILSPAKTKTHKKNMIQVSNTKKPLFFDVNLAKIRKISHKLTHD